MGRDDLSKEGFGDNCKCIDFEWGEK